MTSSVSIIFPVFNNWELTRTCLESIKKLNYAKKKVEIIVVDNHSLDNTANLVKKNFPHVKLIRLKNNLGFARAVNIGAESSLADFLFITNNDVTFDSGFLNNLINFARSDPKIGVCGGKVVTFKNGKKYPDGAANISRLTSRIIRLDNYQKTQGVDYIAGTGILVKKKIFKLLEGFDESFPFYFEDLDFCLRVKSLGLRVVYFPKALMYHRQSSTASKMPSGWLNDVWYEGKARIVAKHFPYWSKPLALFFQLLFCLYVFFTKRQNRFDSVFKALKKTLAHKTRGPQLAKRRQLTQKQILKYYGQGKVFTARNSAPFQQVILKDFYQLLTTNYPTKRWHIMEFGVGHGWNLPLMVKYFGRITAVDIAPLAILESKEFGFKHVSFKLLTKNKLPFKDASFDLIVTTEVLEHVPDLTKTVEELKRITKTGSYILVSVPVYWNLRGLSKKLMEARLGTGTWEPARSHPGGFERFLTPPKIMEYFKDFKIIKTCGADYGTAWSPPAIPVYPKSWAPFFEVTLGKIPLVKYFGMNFYFLAKKT